MSLMFSSCFLNPGLFQLYKSWLTTFFTNVHMLYLLYSKNRPLLSHIDYISDQVCYITRSAKS